MMPRLWVSATQESPNVPSSSPRVPLALWARGNDSPVAPTLLLVSTTVSISERSAEWTHQLLPGQPRRELHVYGAAHGLQFGVQLCPARRLCWLIRYRFTPAGPDNLFRVSLRVVGSAAWTMTPFAGVFARSNWISCESNSPWVWRSPVSRRTAMTTRRHATGIERAPSKRTMWSTLTSPRRRGRTPQPRNYRTASTNWKPPSTQLRTPGELLMRATFTTWRRCLRRSGTRVCRGDGWARSVYISEKRNIAIHRNTQMPRTQGSQLTLALALPDRRSWANQSMHALSTITGTPMPLAPITQPFHWSLL